MVERVWETSGLSGKISRRDISDFRRNNPNPVSYYLLFTDGMNTFGPELSEGSKFPPNFTRVDLECPVYVFNGDDKANHSLLKTIARKSGGEFFNLKNSDDE